jgi:hypothetical protein
MSQVDGFDDTDNATDIMSTQSSMPLANRPKGATEPADAVPERDGPESPAPKGNPRHTPWPKWPSAWPDGSLLSRSAKPGSESSSQSQLRGSQLRHPSVSSRAPSPHAPTSSTSLRRNELPHDRPFASLPVGVRVALPVVLVLAFAARR